MNYGTIKTTINQDYQTNPALFIEELQHTFKLGLSTAQVGIH